jgi:hypothetical protein
MPSQTGAGGKIEIEYYNEGDLDRLYQLLMNLLPEGSPAG